MKENINAKPTGGNERNVISRSDKKEMKQLFNAYRKEMSAAQKTFIRFKKKLETAVKKLESQDRLGNFEIQDLMSAFNQNETFASSVLKKRNDTSGAILGKI